MRIHPRHTNLLFSLFMSLSMAFIMSGVLTAINRALGEQIDAAADGQVIHS
jgi:hypothetical protein